MTSILKLNQNQVSELKSLDQNITRLRGSNQKNSQKLNECNVLIYATMLAPFSTYQVADPKKPKIDADNVVSMKTQLDEANFNPAQKKKKADKWQWLFDYMVVKNDFMRNTNDHSVENIVKIMNDNKITSEAKLMEICNPNKEPELTKEMKMVQAIVGVPAKSGDKYKGGWEQDSIDEFERLFSEAKASRKAFEKELKGAVSKGKDAGAKEKTKQDKIKKFQDAFAPVTSKTSNAVNKINFPT